VAGGEGEPEHHAERARRGQLCQAWLAQNDYVIKEDYASVPRPFDMVVAKGGQIYVVEVKGKWVGMCDDPSRPTR